VAENAAAAAAALAAAVAAAAAENEIQTIDTPFRGNVGFGVVVIAAFLLHSGTGKSQWQFN
jgi:type IV secretory pathway VirB2 component (pilin)